MKITQVRTMLLTGARDHLPGGGSGSKSLLVVRVDADSGVYGLGEADVFPGTRDAIKSLGQFSVGRDAMAITPLMSEWKYGTVAPHPPDSEPYEHTDMPPGLAFPRMCSDSATPWGPVAWAASAVEMALLDLQGKALGTPVYNLLGGAFRAAVPVYVDRSVPDDLTNIDAWAVMGQEAVDEGYRHLKFDIDFAAPDQVTDVFNRSLPAAQLEAVVERLSAVRDTVGSSVEIAADCHMQYNVPDAIRLAHSLEPLRLMWMEDPVPITNVEALAEVRRASRVPICTGEMLTVEQSRMVVAAEAADIVHPDVVFCGGPRDMVRIAEIAEGAYRPMAAHGNGGALALIATAHVGAATRNFLAAEYHFMEDAWVGEFVRREGRGFIEDGKLILSDAPGLGVELDEELCERLLAPGEAVFT
jgi:galactonate dehydratase